MYGNKAVAFATEPGDASRKDSRHESDAGFFRVNGLYNEKEIPSIGGFNVV
ncbi:hypothetical protein JXM67_12835 [candidate division WOR-3 bacterium]|nr:hypothetical protein [candidate division WOR-3 bacterium]